MNEKDQKNDKNPKNIVFNISNEGIPENNNDSNDLKATGAIPKIKNVVNGVPERKIKLNNCNKGIKNPNDVSEDQEKSRNTTDVNFVNSVDKINGVTMLNGVDYHSNDELSSPLWDGAGPSSKNLEESQLSNSPSESDFSSDTGNDELSYCDDYCIYTYKGDIADLPRSFMNLDQENNENGSQAGSRGSSPEMDFLEMDFDPGPSNDIESDNSSLNIDLEEPLEEEHNNLNHNPKSENLKNNLNVDSNPNAINDENFRQINNFESNSRPSEKSGGSWLNETLPNNFETNSDICGANGTSEPQNSFETNRGNFRGEEGFGETNNGISWVDTPKTKDSFNTKIPNSKSDDLMVKNIKEPQPCCSKSENNIFTFTKPMQNNLNNEKLKIEYKNKIFNDPWVPKNPLLRTKASTLLSTDNLKNHHLTGGDLIIFNENIITNSCDVNFKGDISEKTLFFEKNNITNNSNINFFIEKNMIWTEQEALLKQTTQIATSSCGATAVMNVLKALGYEVPSNEKVLECVQTRLRLNNSQLLKYLQSRSLAGSTHEDIILGLQNLSDNQIYSRFFSTYPERYISLSLWLSHWIKLGAVPIATLNLQKTYGNIPDSWHHQMIFGVGPNGIYLTNPLERIDEGILWHQLNSDSEILIRKDDIISRFDFSNLKQMMTLQDVRWKRFNVVGQIANVVREHRLKSKILSRTHVNIPASYKAGITLAIDVNNPACEILRTCPELPIYFDTV